MSHREITVSGRTYPVSKTLKDQGLKWNPEKKIWFGAIGDDAVDFLRSLPGVRVEIGGSVVHTPAAPAPAVTVAAPIADAFGLAAIPGVTVDPEVKAVDDEVAAARALSARLAPSPAPASDPEAILTAPAASFDRAEALALLAQCKADLINAAKKFKALEALIGG